MKKAKELKIEDVFNVITLTLLPLPQPAKRDIYCLIPDMALMSFGRALIYICHSKPKREMRPGMMTKAFVLVP